MRAVICQAGLNPEAGAALQDCICPAPLPGGRDVLVRICAVAVSRPAVRPKNRVQKEAILGWEAAGIVQEVGGEVQHFAAGDEVFYAGSIQRPGAYAEYQLVDERQLARKPHSLSWTEAAALPLAGLTAWEMLFARLDITRLCATPNPSLLIAGGLGPVATLAIQLARQLTALTVIATAFRPELREWARELGAHRVLDQQADLPAQVARLSTGVPDFVLSTGLTSETLPALASLIAPQGRLGLCGDPGPLPLSLLSAKSLSLHWADPFTRAHFRTPDLAAQGQILAGLAGLADAARLRVPVTAHYGPVNAANLRRAYASLHSDSEAATPVLEGFGA